MCKCSVYQVSVLPRGMSNRSTSQTSVRGWLECYTSLNKSHHDHSSQLYTDHAASGASTSVHTQGERVLSEWGTGISESSAPSNSACRAMSLRVSKVSASGALAVRANALGITFTSPSQFDFFNYLIYDTTTSQHNALIVPSNGKE